MNIQDWHQRFKQSLVQEHSKQEVERFFQILMEHHLAYNRAELILNQQEIIGSEQLEKLEEALLNLKQHKPIDYILNQSVFFGFDFYVDERVLIPRSETEELVQLVLEQEQNTKIELLDVGTGSGCIPISLALERPYLKIDACEVSEEALEVARINAKKHKTKIHLFLLDILKEIPKQTYDVLISNPPYVKPEELLNLDRNVIDYEPKIALAPESDPLEFYKRMLSVSDGLLKPGGRLYWEIHEDLGSEVMALFQAFPYEEVKLIQDLYGRDRFVQALYQP